MGSEVLSLSESNVAKKQIGFPLLSWALDHKRPRELRLYPVQMPVQQGTRDISQDPQISPVAGRNRNPRDTPGVSGTLHRRIWYTPTPGRSHMWSPTPAPLHSDCVLLIVQIAAPGYFSPDLPTLFK